MDLAGHQIVPGRFSESLPFCFFGDIANLDCMLHIRKGRYYDIRRKACRWLGLIISEMACCCIRTLSYACVTERVVWCTVACVGFRSVIR